MGEWHFVFWCIPCKLQVGGDGVPRDCGPPCPKCGQKTKVISNMIEVYPELAEHPAYKRRSEAFKAALRKTTLYKFFHGT